MQSDNSTSSLLEQVRALPTATLHEAMGKSGALPSAIKPIDPKMRLTGAAVTVHTIPGDNLLLHRALAVAGEGDVLVVTTSDYYEAGYWGEIMTVAALERGIAGLVIDGCVRDADAIEALAFPVFCRGLCIQGTTKYGNGRLNQPVIIGDTRISLGDMVVGDRDGVVVIPRESLQAAIDAANERERKEAETMAELRRGRTTLDIYGWK